MGIDHRIVLGSSRELESNLLRLQNLMRRDPNLLSGYRSLDLSAPKRAFGRKLSEEPKP